MAIVRWDPFQNISSLQDRINRMFAETFPQTAHSGEDMVTCAWKPAVDIYETENGLKIKAEIAGVHKQDVSIEVKENVLTIQGQRLPDKEVKEENYYRRERCCGIFHRAFTLPDAVAPEKIKATFKDGMLEIDIPRPEQPQARRIDVRID